MLNSRRSGLVTAQNEPALLDTVTTVAQLRRLASAGAAERAGFRPQQALPTPSSTAAARGLDTVGAQL